MSSKLMISLLAASISAPWAAVAQVQSFTRVNVSVAPGMIERKEGVPLRLEYQTPKSNAMERWERAVAANTTATEEWDAIGRALYQAGRYRESVAAFERGLKLSVDGSAESAWFIARAYAQLGNKKQAMRWLTHARQLGYRDTSAIGKEPAFEKYKTDLQFRALVWPSVCSACRARANAGRNTV